MTAERRERGAERGPTTPDLTPVARPPEAPSSTPRDVPPPSATWRASRADFWVRSLRDWDIAFYAMWALAVGALVFDRAAASLPLAVQLTAMAVLLAAYLTFGRRAATCGNARMVLAYLVVLFAVVGIVVAASDTGTLLLFIAFSHIWYFSPSRRAGVTLTVVLTAIVYTVLAGRVDIRTLADAGALATQAGIVIAFSVLLGLRMTQVTEQSEERADLLARLEEAQAEAAASYRAAGVLAERERMAGEIHDTLAQGFTSIVMLSQTAAAALRRNQPEQATDRLALIERTARENLAEARALMAASAPVGLDGSTLAEALARLAQRFSEETGVEVEVVADAAAVADLGREREVVLLRAAQEALSNVRRHAHAHHVRLVLRACPDVGAEAGADAIGAGADAGAETGADAIGAGADAGAGSGTELDVAVRCTRLEIIDDGVGMDPVSVEGFGLRGMRNRVTAGGGELAVQSAVGTGTRVQITLRAADGDVRPDGTEQCDTEVAP